MRGRRGDGDLAAERADAVAHVGQAAAGLTAVGVETGTAVADREAQTPAALMQMDGDGSARAGVFGGVLQRLQAGEVDGLLDLGPLPAQALRVQAHGRGGRLHGGSQRGREPPVLEQRWVDVVHQRAQIFERLLRLVRELAQHQGACLGLVRDALRGEAEVDAQRDEALLGAVVQIALQAPALLVDGLHGAPARGAQLAQRGAAIGLQAGVHVGEVGGGTVAYAGQHPLYGPRVQAAAGETARSNPGETVRPRSGGSRKRGGHVKGACGDRDTGHYGPGGERLYPWKPAGRRRGHAPPAIHRPAPLSAGRRGDTVMGMRRTLMAALASLGFVVAAPLWGCGSSSSSKPSYCAQQEELKQSVKALGEVNVAQGGTNAVKAALSKVESSAKGLVEATKSEFPTQTQALSSSISELSKSVGALSSSSSAATIAAIPAQVVAVGSAASGLASATSSKCG